MLQWLRRRLARRRREEELCMRLREAPLDEQRRMLAEAFSSELMRRILEADWIFETREFMECTEEARREGIPEVLCAFYVVNRQREKVEAMLRAAAMGMSKKRLAKDAVMSMRDKALLDRLLEVCAHGG